MMLYAPSRVSSAWKLVLVNKELRMASPLETPVPKNIVDVMHMGYIMHMVHIVYKIRAMHMSELQSSM